MKLTDIPSPGIHSSHGDLRLAMSKALGHIQCINTFSPEGATERATIMQAFLDACSEILAEYLPTTPPPDPETRAKGK